MQHRTAMKDTRIPVDCAGELVKGNWFDSQDFHWQEAMCPLCHEKVALLSGFSHRFNYVIQSEQRPYRDGLLAM